MVLENLWNQTEIIRSLVYALAVFRLTMLLHEEDGPWSLFDWMRFKTGLGWDSLEGKPFFLHEDPSFMARLLACPYCLSGWLSLGAVLLLSVNNFYVDVFALWFCLWSVVYLLLKAVSK